MKPAVWIAATVVAATLAVAAVRSASSTRTERVEGKYRFVEERVRWWTMLPVSEWGVGLDRGPIGCGKDCHSAHDTIRFGVFGLRREDSWSRHRIVPFGPVREFRLNYADTTGPSDYVQLPEGEVALDYDKDESDRLALGAFMGLRYEVLNMSGDRIVLVGQIEDRSRPSNPKGEAYPEPVPMRTFRLLHWYLKPPFKALDPDKVVDLPHILAVIQRTSLKRGDFVAKDAYGFSPDDPNFDPRRYERPLPKP